ncbi:MAG TPA: glycosyltransferase 87 family protein, partial [Micromonosporaceae bacterium]|nr:glycosyltransferase 87 family protein [Micromonosporaceae bacterium]
MPATVIGRIRRLSIHQVRGFDRWAIVRLGIVAGAVIGAVLAVRAFGRPYIFFDLRIYHGAVVWWWDGGDLYDYVAPDITLGYTYPPFAALVMLPMVAVSATVAGYLNVLASLAALAVVLAILLVPIADRYGWPRWFAVALALPLAAATEPVRETLGYGQVNLLLFALLMADLVALRWRYRSRDAGAGVATGLRRLWTEGAWAGVGVGLATAVKLTPALFICYFLVTKQWRVAVTALATAVGVTIAGFLLASHESFTYFTSVMWQTQRVGQADMTPNQSLAGLLARLYDSDVTPGLLWLAFAMLLLAVGLS